MALTNDLILCKAISVPLPVIATGLGYSKNWYCHNY